MCVSHPAALLLVLAVISVPGGAVDVPQLFTEIPDCMKGYCSEMIGVCRRRHGDALTDELKGCVAESCIQDILGCVDWFVMDLMTLGMVSSPLSFGEKYSRHNGGIMEKTLLHCSRDGNHQHPAMFVGCILEDLLSKAKSYLNILSWLLGISEPGQMSCWLRNAVKLSMKCFYDVDENYFILVDNNLKLYQSIYQKEYTRCSVNIFKDKKCFQMFSQIFGSTPEILVQSKGIFICMINSLVLSVAEC
ncbi:uncharacterized protein [Hoplias malabaricus]|uniref:uncharacterized protein n=1 Tax=Hoplias malabaricus TaxID=27720 RepID=UPI0034621D83